MGNEAGSMLGEDLPRAPTVRYGPGTISVEVRTCSERRRRLQNPPCKRTTRQRCMRPPAPACPELCELLMNTLAQHLTEPRKDRTELGFDSCKVPKITVFNYLRRLDDCTDTSAEVLGAAVVHVLRYLEKTGSGLHSLNIHRLLLTAFTLSSKMHEEPAFQNVYYAESGGVTLAELNRMEELMLSALDFDLRVTMAEIDAVLGNRLEEFVPPVPRDYDWFWFHGQPRGYS
eukprot:TRINITY_DN62128_c0_g1_i1.p1 TRINITY_DN62128_c0_g1~~TRINITY_DN62128_c0_g1_i1.p1  ORF type:complete len:230 (+),score=85.28 TRINITY_DN62128_c0_g1_i1:284-973(+)